MVRYITYSRITGSCAQRLTFDIYPILVLSYQTLLIVTLLILLASIRPNENVTSGLVLTFDQAINYKLIPFWIWTVLNLFTLIQTSLLKPVTAYWFFNTSSFVDNLIDENRKKLVEVSAKNILICGVLSGVLNFLAVVLVRNSSGSNFAQVLLLFLEEMKQLSVLGEIAGFVVILGSIRAEKSNENTLKLYDIMVSLFLIFTVTNSIIFVTTILECLKIEFFYFLNAVVQYVNLAVFYISQFCILQLVSHQTDIGIPKTIPKLIMQIE